MLQIRPDRHITPLYQDNLSVAAVDVIRVAVLIPCYNEELTIARVVADFRTSLPGAVISVYDNNSSDRTQSAAREAGAVVRNENLRGKGHVVRRMFADLEADVYVLVDGDDTYDADAAPEMVRLLVENQLDMVTAVRVHADDDAYPRGHRFGNRLFNFLIHRMFGSRTSDALSGYRVFSRRFVKSFPALATGFETETEFTVHALELMMPVGEVATAYRSRVAGSRSKLHTVRDGVRILRTIMMLVKQERPLRYFGLTTAILLAAGLGTGVPVVMHFMRTGLVPQLPSALLAVGLVLAATLSLVCGLVLEQVSRGRKELKRLTYLRIPAVGPGR